MGTLNFTLVVEWRVDAGPPRTVQFEKATPYYAHEPEGSAITDEQKLIDYILRQQPAAERNRLLELARRGLLTVTAMPHSEINVPALPPAVP